MERAQRVDKKNKVICLVIMFPPRVMIIKMLRMADFLYYLLMIAKNFAVWTKHLSAPERSY